MGKYGPADDDGFRPRRPKTMRADSEWDETWRTDEAGERRDFVMHVHLPPRFQVGVLMGPGGAHMAAIQRRFNLVSIGVDAVNERDPNLRGVVDDAFPHDKVRIKGRRDDVQGAKDEIERIIGDPDLMLQMQGQQLGWHTAEDVRSWVARKTKPRDDADDYPGAAAAARGADSDGPPGFVDAPPVRRPSGIGALPVGGGGAAAVAAAAAASTAPPTTAATTCSPSSASTRRWTRSSGCARACAACCASAGRPTSATRRTCCAATTAAATS